MCLSEAQVYSQKGFLKELNTLYNKKIQLCIINHVGLVQHHRHNHHITIMCVIYSHHDIAEKSLNGRYPTTIAHHIHKHQCYSSPSVYVVDSLQGYIEGTTDVFDEESIYNPS